MASSAEHTASSIRAKLDSELPIEIRKSFLQELIATPGCSEMLIEVANEWRSELFSARLHIMQSNELVRVKGLYIDSIIAHPYYFQASKCIDTAEDVIDKTLSRTTREQIAFEKSADYAEITYLLLDELLGVIKQEEVGSFSP